MNWYTQHYCYYYIVISSNAIPSWASMEKIDVGGEWGGAKRE